MKYSQLVVLLGAVSVSGMKLEKNQRSLFDTSLVMLEAGIPVPTASAPIKKTVKTSTDSAARSWQTSIQKPESIEKSSFVSTKAENEVILDQHAEVDRKKKKDGPTTLTIVQDFPKKRNGSQSKMQLVQGRETNMNTAKDFSVDTQKPTTLTIVQDFPKKKTSHAQNHGIEMVQGKAKDFTIEPPVSTVSSHHVTGEKQTEINDATHPQHKEEGATLTIVQEFPKKKVDSAQQGTELVQGEETVVHNDSTIYERGVKKMAFVGSKLFEAKTFIEDLFGVNN